MRNERKRKRTYRSMAEFKRVYLPLPSRRSIMKTPEEAKALGTRIAKESLSRIKLRLPSKPVSS